jgi:hypothetical protein
MASKTGGGVGTNQYGVKGESVDARRNSAATATARSAALADLETVGARIAGFTEANTAYLTCALWSSTDDDGDPLDVYDTDDIDPDTRARMAADLAAFMEANADDLAGIPPEQIGHDFWLTRNRHGAGFWDRGLGERGTRLTDAAHVYGEVSLFANDDGTISD